MAAEFELNGKRYRVGKLNAINQLHLLRKIGPIIVRITPELTNMEQVIGQALPSATDGQETEAQTTPVNGLVDVVKMMGPIFDAFSEMADKDIEYLQRLCLSVAKREEAPNKWVDCWNTRAAMPQFMDIDGPGLITIGINVVQENLGGFLAEGPSNFGEQMLGQPVLN